MFDDKFGDYRTTTSKEDFEGFYHIWVWRSSWSCDQDHLYITSLLHFHIKRAFDWPSGLEEKMDYDIGHIHVNSPGARADHHLESVCYYVNLFICCKVFSNDFVTAFWCLFLYCFQLLCVSDDI